jgi:hypothetical protein
MLEGRQYLLMEEMMNPQLTALLYERYPRIFQEHAQPESQMSKGIATGDGWFVLLDALCSILQFGCDHNDAPQIVAQQIKERGGVLRFHAFNRTDRQDGMIQMAEAMSARICDVCGQSGKRVDIGSQVSTRCPEHSTASIYSQEVSK